MEVYSSTVRVTRSHEWRIFIFIIQADFSLWTSKPGAQPRTRTTLPPHCGLPLIRNIDLHIVHIFSRPFFVEIQNPQ